MTWKVINISDSGTGSKFGADDLDKVNKGFAGIDVDDYDINSDFKFRSGKLQIRNPANTFSYIINPAAIAADRTLNLPLLTSTDTLAVLGLQQDWTQPQFIAKDATDLLTLRRDTNTNGSVWELNFDAKDSVNNFQPYAAVRGEIISSTSGAEGGALNFITTKAGVEKRNVRVMDTGKLRCGGENTRVELDETGLTATRTFTFPDFDTRLASVNAIQFKYVITKSGANTICIDTNGGTIVSTNSNASVPIQYAIDNAAGLRILIKAGTYALGTSLNGVDKTFHIYGEGNIVGGASDSFSTVLQKTHSGTLLNIHNTVRRSGQSLHDISLTSDVTNDNLGTGIDANFCVYNFPFLENVNIDSCTTNVRASSQWYDTYVNCSLGNGVTGVKFTNNGEAGHVNGCNTQIFIGGTIEDCVNYDVYAEVCENVQFLGTIIEGGDALINAVYCGVNSEFVNIDHCDLEVYNDNPGQVIISDHGINNRFNGLRLYHSQQSITGIEFTSTSQNATLSNCELAAGKIGFTGKTITVDVQSGATNTNIINNKTRSVVSTVTVATTVTVNNNGTNTRYIGNDFINDRFGDIGCDNITITDTKNIILSTGTGTKIGTGTTQKLGFFNKTPIAQKGANADTSGATLPNLEIEVNEIKQLLRDYGLMA